MIRLAGDVVATSARQRSSMALLMSTDPIGRQRTLTRSSPLVISIAFSSFPVVHCAISRYRQRLAKRRDNFHGLILHRDEAFNICQMAPWTAALRPRVAGPGPNSPRSSSVA